MNYLNDINESETIKFKKKSQKKKYHKDNNCKSYLLIALIALIFFIVIFFIRFYFINKKVNENYLSQLQEKEKIIENLKAQLNNTNYISPAPEEKMKFKSASTERQFSYDKNFYMLNAMNAPKDNKGNGIGYNILYYTHSLEKG